MPSTQSPHYLVYVDGRFRSGTGAQLSVRDPSTGQVLLDAPSASTADVDACVAAAVEDQSGWAAIAPRERGRFCFDVARTLRERADSLVAMIVEDAGLPPVVAARDVETSARYFEYYGGLADKIGGVTIPMGATALDYTMREPWGVCGVVLPFNVPMQMAARSVAPALAMGNAVVLKPAEQAPFAPLVLASICTEVGLPTGLVSAATAYGDVAEYLVQHPGVDHVTFTGSLTVGSKVMSAAARRIKPVLLELGGKSPQIVFEDADLDDAVRAAVDSTLRTAGQVCSASSRMLVSEQVLPDVLERVSAAADALQVGAADSNPDVGPVITAVQRDRIQAMVAKGINAGERLLTRTDPPPPDGYFVRPAVLAVTDRNSSTAAEETFGPVLAVLSFDSEQDAINLANSNDYGLVAGVWTHDIKRARVAARVRAGQVFVNNYGVGGGVELPFGGYRRSGFGRLKGEHGALEYTQTKNVCVAL